MNGTNRSLKEQINSRLRGNCKLYIFDELNSTNTTLKEMAEKGISEGTVIIARKQTQGRGTQGRKFYSPANGLYMSLLVRPKINIQESIFLTVSTAVAVVSAIKKVTGIKCGIKWVNDIIYNNKKVGGILTEGEYDNSSNRLKYAIVGLGLNLSSPKDGFPKEIKNIAGTLYNDELTDKLYCKLVATIINKTFKFYKQLSRKKYIKNYQKYSILKQREISYKQNGEIHTGKVIAIDKEARLVVENNGKKIKLSAGEVTLLKV